MALGDPYLILEYIGTVAFAVSGGAVAVRARMDWLGVTVLAVVAAVGGGTLRDLLLGRLPVGWIQVVEPAKQAFQRDPAFIGRRHDTPRFPWPTVAPS